MHLLCVLNMGKEEEAPCSLKWVSKGLLLLCNL